jgi:hypothetical protein
LNGSFSIYQFIRTLHIIPLILLLGTFVNIIMTAIMPDLSYSQTCPTLGHATLKRLDEYPGGLSSVNNSIFKEETKLCAGQIAQLTIINRVNTIGCFTQECLLASNSTIRVLGNNPNLQTFTGSAMGVKVMLGPGRYTVVQPIMVTFYRHWFSPECSGVISAGETKAC